MMMSRSIADDVASRVFNHAKAVLGEATRPSDGRLQAFAHGDSSMEKWLVLETYGRIFRYWDRDFLPLVGSESRSWVEVVLPGTKNHREHLDLFVGPHEPSGGVYSDNEYDQPCRSTPVFEFKFIRESKRSDGINKMEEDIAKINRGGLVHGYLIGLLAYPEEPGDRTDDDLFPSGGAEYVAREDYTVCKREGWARKNAFFRAVLYRVKRRSK